MSRKDPKLLILTALAIVFTVALTFATLEAPRAINFILRTLFPDHGIGEFELIEEFLRYVRPIGYGCLLAVIALIVVGFITRKGTLSSLGSLAFFLPTFGYFALSMFFLAGVGILRVLWMPFWDSSTNILKLGDVIYLPYMILVYPFALTKVDIRVSLASLTTGTGLLIFFVGTITWFYGKLTKKETIDFWIYKYSRHPQYVGYIIWSYGVMLLASLSIFPRGGYNPAPSLPWLISALIVTGVALGEEIEMAEKHGENYLKYQHDAPFMIPLPKLISKAITTPTRALFKENLPENRRQIIITLALHGLILIVLSLPFLLLNWPPGLGWFAWPWNTLPL